MRTFKTIFASMAILLGAMTAVSCSDDKDDTPDTPAAKEIAGVYKGDMTCSVMGSESTFEDMTFTVSATDDATASIAVSDFGNPPMKVPGFTIEGVKVSGEDGEYTLAPTEFSGTTDGGKNFSGTAQGSYSGSTLTVKFSLNYGAMPMPMICTFSAPKE